MAINDSRLSREEKFLTGAKEFEADEPGETFDRTFKAIATHKSRGTN